MLYFEAIYIHSFYPNIAWHVLSIYNKNEHLKSTYVCSKGFTCLLSYPLTLLVVASLFIYISSCFFQGSPWWQERPVYGIITALRNSFSIHGEITHFKVNKTNWIFEITPTYYLISFVDLCFFLQHGDRQQHLVGGRDHASWNVFSQRLKVNRRSCSCSRTHRDSCLPIGSVNVFPTPELWSTPSLMDSPLSTPRHPSQRPSDIIVMLVMGLLFFFMDLSMPPSDWFIYEILLKALNSATQFVSTH